MKATQHVAIFLLKCMNMTLAKRSRCVGSIITLLPSSGCKLISTIINKSLIYIRCVHVIGGQLVMPRRGYICFTLVT